MVNIQDILEGFVSYHSSLFDLFSDYFFQLVLDLGHRSLLNSCLSSELIRC